VLVIIIYGKLRLFTVIIFITLDTLYSCMGRKDDYVSITLPPELKAKIKESADNHNRSLTQEIRVAIEAYLMPDMTTIYESTTDLKTKHIPLEDLESMVRDITLKTIEEHCKKVNK